MGETIFGITLVIAKIFNTILFTYCAVKSLISTDKHSQIMYMLYAILVAVLNK